MHGAWGALTTLIKKQNAAKNRKAALSYDHQRKKEKFLKDHSDGYITELEFPKFLVIN